MHIAVDTTDVDASLKHARALGLDATVDHRRGPTGRWSIEQAMRDLQDGTYAVAS